MSELIVVGDRVLIAPEEGETQTEAGLVLPASVAERQDVRMGKVEQVGPGYVMPQSRLYGRALTTDRDSVRYLPLQAQPGDHAFFLKKEAVEIKFKRAGLSHHSPLRHSRVGAPAPRKPCRRHRADGYRRSAAVGAADLNYAIFA